MNLQVHLTTFTEYEKWALRQRMERKVEPLSGEKRKTGKKTEEGGNR